MKNVRLIALIVCVAMAFPLLGCRPVQGTAPEEGPVAESTAEPTLEPTAEPTPEPTPDPATMIAEAEILEGRHEREKDYSAPFKTHYIDTPYAAVHLEDNADYSEETLRAIAQSVLTDVFAIRTRTGETTGKVTVYVVSRMLKDRPVLLGDRLFCTAADIESGAYREALCGACFALSIPWKQVGLSEYVFGTADESGLKEYYADEAHALTASCAAVYLLPAIADEETVDAAKKTAASITAFVLESDGVDALRAAESTAAILPAWAARLGIETPALPNGFEQAGSMTAESDRKYLCILRTDNFTINVTEGAFAQTPDELYSFVCKLYYGMGFVLEQIREELPSYTELVETRYAEGIHIDLIVPTQELVSRARSGSAWIITEGVVWHEIVHVLLEESVNNKDLWWICEALAEHFSHKAASLAIPWDEVDESMFDDVDDETPAYRVAFFRAIWPIFLLERELDVSVPEGVYSDHAHARTVGIGELLLDDNLFSRGEDESIAGVRGRDAGDVQTEGNAMTYSEALVVLEYLFDVYGTETVVNGYMNGRPLSETCGKPYAELYEDCITYLTERYGKLLNGTN